MHLQDSVPWPPQPKDLEPEKFTLPNKLNLIMKSFLNDIDEQSSHTDRLRGQDICIYIDHKRNSKSTQDHSSPFYD